MNKDRQISKKKKEIEKLFESLPANKKALLDDAFQNCAFMAITLRELQKDITTNGTMIQYQSGNGFDTLKDNPSVKAYTTMIARFNQTMAMIIPYLPEEVNKSKLTELLDE